MYLNIYVRLVCFYIYIRICINIYVCVYECIYCCCGGDAADGSVAPVDNSS